MRRRASWIPVFAALAILIAMFIGAQLYFGYFLTPRVLSSLLLDNAYLLILAVGMTFVILTAGIDLSVGAVMAFTGMLGASLMRDGLPSALVAPVMLADRRDDRPVHRRAGAVLRRAAVHRLARGDVPRPRARVRREPQLDQGGGSRDPLAAGHAHPERPGGWYITPTGIIALLAVLIGASSSRTRGSAARSTRSAAASSPRG